MPLSENSAPFIGPFPDRRVATVAGGWLCLLLIGGTVYVSNRWFFLSSNDVIWLRIMQSKPPLTLAWERFAVGAPLDYRPLATLYFMVLQALFGDWAPGYYYVLFEDPDGIRVEINHVPGAGVLAPGIEFNSGRDYA